jgi:hypothetical protein
LCRLRDNEGIVQNCGLRYHTSFRALAECENMAKAYNKMVEFITENIHRQFRVVLKKSVWEEEINLSLSQNNPLSFSIFAMSDA